MLKKTIVAAMLLVSLSCFGFTENKDGSVVLTPKDLAQLNDQVNSLARQAYEQGVKDGVEAVKSNPKLCPKDI